MTLPRLSCFLVLLAIACGAGGKPAHFPVEPPLLLRGSDAKTHDVAAELSKNRLTAFVFYSQDCPCMRAHEPRLFAIHREYAPRGVAVVLVDSELSADATRDAHEAKVRGYPFVLLTDPDARLAKVVGADFATHAVVVDSAGRIRYSGGIDSDKNRTHDGATPYLRDALEDLLAGRQPRNDGAEALGCALMTR